MVQASQIKLNIIEGLLAQVVQIIEKLIAIKWQGPADKAEHSLKDWQHASWRQGRHCFGGVEAACWSDDERRGAAARCHGHLGVSPGTHWIMKIGGTTTTHGEAKRDGEMWSSDAK